MPRKQVKTFTDKELEIMKVIWESGEATAKQIQKRLPGEQHYNSVLTIIRVLERKAHLAHRVEGRAFVYRARMSQDKSRSRMLSHLVKYVFGGSASSLVLHLIETGDLTSEDLREIRHRASLLAKH